MCTFGISRQPRGAALVVVMLVTAVLLLAGTSFLTISSTEILIALNERASAQAHLLAEAAIHKAVAKLNDPATPIPYTGEPTTTLGGGTFTINVTTSILQRCPANSAKDLVATASVPVTGGTAKAVIRATLDKISYPYRWAAFAAVPNEIVSTPNNIIFGADRTEKELWLSESVAVDSFDSGAGPYDATANSGRGGHIGGNGDVTLEPNVTVYGNVQAGETVHDVGAQVTGIKTEGLSPSTDPGVKLPSVTPPLTATIPLIVGVGEIYPLDAGPHAFTSINIADNATLATSGGTVTVYVTGIVNIGNNVMLGAHPGTQLRIISKSDGSPTDSTTFLAGSDFRLYGSLYGKNTDVKLGDRTQVFGSIIARTTLTSKDSKIHYDQAMSSQEVCHNGKFTIRRGTWREVIPN